KANLEVELQKKTLRLKELEEDFEYLFQHSLYPIFLIDLKGRFVEVNEKACSLLGYTRKELLSMDILKIHPKNSLAKEALLRIDSGQTLLAGINFITKDRRSIPVELYARRATYQSMPHIQIMAKDITRETRLEEEKSKIKNRLEAILNGIDEGLAVIDRNYKIRSTNRAFVQSLRYAGKSVVGKYCYKVLHNYAKACKQCVVRNTLQTGKSSESIRSRRDSDGTKIYLETRAYPLRDAEGNINQVICIFREITKRKKLEERIRYLKEYNESIVASVPSSILVVDKSLRVVSANESFYEDFELEKKEVETKSIERVLPAELNKVILEAIRTGSFLKKEEVETTFPRIGRKVLHISVVGTKLEEDEEERTLIIIEDLSEKKQLEDELIRSGKLAALGELSAGLAHEINNPLAIISGYAQMLQAESAMDEARKQHYLKEIVEQTDRAARIMRKVRDFARPGESRMESVDINEPLIRILSLLKDQAHLKNIRINKNLDLSLPRIKADKDQLEQIFLNIILNAVQAMPNGGELTLRTNLRRQGAKVSAKRVELTIIDTGCGVPKENLGKIFDPFFTTKQKSSGLGLSITHSLVNQHHGTIAVQSQVGKGTTFVITFPLSSEEKEK
ncbi:PAS domain-containing sensor histidine kinase, partial [Candidatus Aerophobetes bacterium]